MKDKKYVIGSNLIKEWNYEKNNKLGLYPDKLMLSSHKKVWWLGKCGHEWDSIISNRNRGVGCPYCANQKILAGYNDLATTNPELAKEWNYEKNDNLKPTEVIAGSGKKVWWKCKKDHEWRDYLYNRNKGDNCPYCSNKQVLQGYNDLTTTNTELAKEWHPTKNKLKPTDVTQNSGKKAWWICDKGHEWEATINNRNRNNSGNGCPVCLNRQILEGYNDLATTNPELAKEWHPTKNDLKNTEVVAGSNKKAWWICDKGHEWEARIAHRNKGVGCPKCSEGSRTSFNEKVIAFYLKPFFDNINENCKPSFLKGRELDIYIPKLDLAIEYDGEYYHQDINRDIEKNKLCIDNNIKLIRIREPKCPILNDSSSINYILKNFKNINLELAIKFIIEYINKNYSYNLQISINIEKDRNSIYDSINYSELKNSLAIINPELAKAWHPTKNGSLKPNMFLPNSNKKVWWICDKGHEWNTSICDRNKGSNCPICSGHQVLKGYNDLITINPELAKEWNYDKNDSKPNIISPNSNKKVWWKCDKGHEWKTSPNERNGYKKTGCPYCSNHRVLKGFNDLNTTNSELAKEWHPTKNDLKSTEVTQNSGKKVWWLGKCGHEWQDVISSRNKGYNCPYCSNHRVLKGFNDLVTTNPELAKEWHPTKNDLKPTDVTQNSGKKAWWLGKCGHEWEARIAHRNNGIGCPICSNQKVLSGYNDLMTTNPELAKELHPTKNDLKSTEVTQNSGKKIWWLGKCGHEWEAIIYDRNKGNGCPICSNQKVLIGYNDLATTNTKLAKEWHPTKNGDLKPTDVVAGSDEKVWWVCNEGHEWKTGINNRKKSGCPYCLNQKVLSGYNDLSTTNPELAKEWHPIKNGDLKPTDVVAGSNKKVWWKCSYCGNEYEKIICKKIQCSKCPDCNK